MQKNKKLGQFRIILQDGGKAELKKEKQKKTENLQTKRTYSLIVFEIQNNEENSELNNQILEIQNSEILQSHKVEAKECSTSWEFKFPHPTPFLFLNLPTPSIFCLCHMES